MPTDRPGLDAGMPCRQLTKACRRDGESERRPCQDYRCFGFLGDAPAERGVRGRLDRGAWLEDETDLIAANKLVRRPSVAQRRQARPRGGSRGFEL